MTIQVTANGVQIVRVTLRPDGRVEIWYTIATAGTYVYLPNLCTADPPGAPPPFPMTPALWDPTHSIQPLGVGVPGVLYCFVWDALADGYQLSSINGWKFDLALMDLFCCENLRVEFDDEETGNVPPPPPLPPGGGVPPFGGFPGPGGAIPPGIRPPPGAPPPPPPDPEPPPDVQPPPEPREPGGVSLQPGGTAGGQDPTDTPDFGPPVQDPNFYLLDPAFLHQPWLVRTKQDPGVTPGYPIPAPVGWPAGTPWPPTTPGQYAGGFYAGPGGVIYNEAGNPVGSIVPPLVAFPFQARVDVAPPAPASTSAGSSLQIQGSPVPVLRGTDPLAEKYGFPDPNQTDFYEPVPELAFWYGIPNETNGLKVWAYSPLSVVPQHFPSNLYFVLENTTGSDIHGISYLILGMDQSGLVKLIQAPADVQGATSGATPPPGVVPPGVFVGKVACIDWFQWALGQVKLLVGIIGPGGVPLAAGGAVVSVAAPTGTPVPTQIPPNEELGPLVRQIGQFPSGILPVFEGSVNAYGDEDMYLFTPRRHYPVIVVKTTPEAIMSGFVPMMEIYDLGNTSAPVATCTTRLRSNGVDIEPDMHHLGWVSDADLQIGIRYGIVVRHSYPYYSKKWAFKIFHIEGVPSVDLLFSIDGNGDLAGGIVCPYARQSLKLINRRTGLSIFVRTNIRGECLDVQTNSRPARTLLACRRGDEIEVLRPGPAVVYRRHGDLIGKMILP